MEHTRSTSQTRARHSRQRAAQGQNPKRARGGSRGSRGTRAAHSLRPPAAQLEGAFEQPSDGPTSARHRVAVEGQPAKANEGDKNAVHEGADLVLQQVRAREAKEGAAGGAHGAFGASTWNAGGAGIGGERPDAAASWRSKSLRDRTAPQNAARRRPSLRLTAVARPTATARMRPASSRRTGAAAAAQPGA